MERDSKQLDADVRDLVARALPEMSGASLAEAAQALLDGHERARADDRERDRLRAQRSDRQDRRDELLVAIADADGEVGDLFRIAGVESLEALEDAERRAGEAALHRSALTEVTDKLLAAGAGAGIEALIEETRGVDADRATARLREIESEIDEAQEALERAADQLARQQGGLEKMGSGAADAALEVEHLVAPLRANVRQYVRLRVATMVLEKEVERYRRENQGPILSRASELFPRLTLGRYAALSVGYDETDAATLRAIRADGDEIGIGALSDGTRDQLFLALRLATLERHARHSEPMPLVLDDVLIHFDDDRARAALSVLGDFAERYQVLFFTHHARLRELAREALPAPRLAELDLPEAE
jgi:uncharacterized protein YhaN